MFADAHSISAGERKVELVGENETASVFRDFLKLVSEGKLALTENLVGIIDLAHFLKKWDCPAVLANLLCAVQLRLMKQEISPLAAFELAAAMDDVDTAKTALTILNWEWPESDAATHGIPSHPVLDPRAWNLFYWRDISNADYIFALIRAYGDVGNTDNLADKFVEYLEAAKAVPR